MRMDGVSSFRENSFYRTKRGLFHDVRDAGSKLKAVTTEPFGRVAR